MPHAAAVRRLGLRLVFVCAAVVRTATHRLTHTPPMARRGEAQVSSTAADLVRFGAFTLGLTAAAAPALPALRLGAADTPAVRHTHPCQRLYRPPACPPARSVRRVWRRQCARLLTSRTGERFFGVGTVGRQRCSDGPSWTRARSGSCSSSHAQATRRRSSCSRRIWRLLLRSQSRTRDRAQVGLA